MRPRSTVDSDLSRHSGASISSGVPYSNFIDPRRSSQLVAQSRDLYVSCVTIPCVNSAAKGSVKPILPIRSKRPCPEARIEQVQDRMFDAANILRHRHPAFGLFAVERLVGGLAGKADEIPARIGKGIERVGFAPRRFLAIGAGHVLPRRVAIKRIAGHIEAYIFGQHHRQ